METTDEDLLQHYLQGSQDAFAELVRRHLDLVYSAARRQAPAAHLAEEITQSVFISLSHSAATLKPGTPLVAWLHLATRHTAIDAARRDARRRAREQVALEISAMNSTPSVWSQVEPLLDEAVAALPEQDRSAILLRYFESQSLREIGQFLGTSEDAAQKRVSRAVDQLRAFFLKRGVTISAAGLAMSLSTHALQAAPLALGTTIFSAVSATSPWLGLASAKTLVMTAAQKTILVAAAVLFAGTALYEGSILRGQRADLAASAQTIARLQEEIQRARTQTEATSRELGTARDQLTRQQTTPSGSAEMEIQAWLTRIERVKQLFQDHPEQAIPEMKLLSENNWSTAVQNANLDDDSWTPRGRRDTMMSLRNRAKVQFAFPALGGALRAYIGAHKGQLPSDVRELLPFFQDTPFFKAAQVEESMLLRYAIVHSGTLADVPGDERSAMLVEITSSEEEHDTRIIVGHDGGGFSNFLNLRMDTQRALRAFTKANGGAAPANAAQLLPYFYPALSRVQQERFLQYPENLPLR